MPRAIHQSEQRVRQLRSQLAQQGLSGFIIPHADEYQGDHART